MDLSSNLLWVVILTILAGTAIAIVGVWQKFSKMPFMSSPLTHAAYGIVIVVLMILVISMVKSMQCPAANCPTNPPAVTPPTVPAPATK